MRMQLIVASWSVALATGASALLAAPGQTTATPGQMTQARVWIQNRGRSEAVPISLQDVAVDVPLRVRVTNGMNAANPDEPLHVRVMPEPRNWQYESVTIEAGDDIAAALSARGNAGWETTGITIPAANGAMTVLLKRPR